MLCGRKRCLCSSLARSGPTPLVAVLSGHSVRSLGVLRGSRRASLVSGAASLQRVVQRLLVRSRETTDPALGGESAGTSTIVGTVVGTPKQWVAEAVGVEGLGEGNPEVLRLRSLIVSSVVARHRLRCHVEVATKAGAQA
jgi:hypothetical protein